jgi:hypothetical protein
VVVRYSGTATPCSSARVYLNLHPLNLLGELSEIVYGLSSSRELPPNMPPNQLVQCEIRRYVPERASAKSLDKSDLESRVGTVRDGRNVFLGFTGAARDPHPELAWSICGIKSTTRRHGGPRAIAQNTS